MYVKCSYSFLIYNISNAGKFKGDWCEQLTTFVKKENSQAYAEDNNDAKWDSRIQL